MAKVAGQRITVLIGQPFVFGGVGVSGTNILALQMLQLTVNIVTITHFDLSFACFVDGDDSKCVVH